MADIESGGGGGHKKGPGVKKSKKLSTRVDLTPMVDLGFLLITFFIFTTTMSSPTAMKLNMPDDTAKDEEQNKAKESGALTIMLSKNDHIYYYEGKLAEDGSNFKSAIFGKSSGDAKGIRDIIIEKKQKLGAEADKDMVVVIKPNEESTFKNTVDMLDEMTINGVKKYALVKISVPENQLIKLTEGGSK
ncbi:MAG: biopolymer transporter ExbD [Sphingobacteriales bacterium]|nr:biopolymer transporter ExbD [Sphingobacteriales bacterium]MBI3717123.1 biopolymer transporter ExbD [Sphingobacteriales bacterium]